MPHMRVEGSATFIQTACGIGKESKYYAMGILEIAVLLTAALSVASIPIVLTLVIAFLVYRKLKIVGLLVYLLILFTAWKSDGYNGLLWINVFLSTLIMIAYAIRGLFRSVRGLVGLASEGISNRKEEIAAAGGPIPTAGELEEKTTTPKVVGKRDREGTRALLSEAWPSEFDLLGEPSEPEQEESLPESRGAAERASRDHLDSEIPLSHP